MKAKKLAKVLKALSNEHRLKLYLEIAKREQSDFEEPECNINVVVWESGGAFEAVVNAGFGSDDGENADGMKVLGRGFPEPIVVHPGRYTVIASDG